MHHDSGTSDDQLFDKYIVDPSGVFPHDDAWRFRVGRTVREVEEADKNGPMHNQWHSARCGAKELTGRLLQQQRGYFQVDTHQKP